MAEFIEVMEQAKRMCEAFRDGHCSECPVGNAKVLECGIMVTSEMDCEEVEHRVMQWANDHPEAKYPSWEDGWKQLFPEAEHVPCPYQYFGDGSCCERYGDCKPCKASPMPADIAEKLGIKPKEHDDETQSV